MIVASERQHPQLHRIDSSDDEREEVVVRNITKAEYVQFLANSINSTDISGVLRHKAAELKMGLVLHHYADRVFNNGDIRAQYQDQESRLLNFDKEAKTRSIGEIKKLLMTAQLITTQQDRNRLFKADINQLEPKVAEQIFNYAFNDKGPKPAALQDNISKDVLKTRFQEAFRSSSNIDLSFLHQHQNIQINLEQDRISMPIAAELIRRAARDLSKEMQLCGSDRQQVTAVKLGNMPSTHIECRARASGNIQLEPLVGVSTYQKESDNIKKYAEHIAHVITTRAMPPNLPHGDAHKVLELACLMGIAEVVRSKSTLFTTPMFLDKLRNAPASTNIEEYPMAMGGAVNNSRAIHQDYSERLPNARKMDEDMARSATSGVLLAAEGKLLYKWTAQHGFPQLEDIRSMLSLIDDLEGKKSSQSIPKIEYTELADKLAKAYRGNRGVFQLCDIDQDFVDKFQEHANSASRGNISGDSLARYKALITKSEALAKNYDQDKVNALMFEGISKAIDALDTHILRGYYHIDPEKLFASQQRQLPQQHNAPEERNVVTASSDPSSSHDVSLLEASLPHSDTRKRANSLASSDDTSQDSASQKPKQRKQAQPSRSASASPTETATQLVGTLSRGQNSPTHDSRGSLSPSPTYSQTMAQQGGFTHDQ